MASVAAVTALASMAFAVSPATAAPVSGAAQSGAPRGTIQDITVGNQMDQKFELFVEQPSQLSPHTSAEITDSSGIVFGHMASLSGGDLHLTFEADVTARPELSGSSLTFTAHPAKNDQRGLAFVVSGSDDAEPGK
ncbi:MULTISPECIES: hypothetical protein [unclassified Leucobacter]|uniref:hypothetical protein n=1 Tax=unclassified Leucobacter TaxID=2621730 RepID=UPI00117A8D7E|nr:MULTISPECIES: hypothetical protein [unclassified Leucobacter]